MTSRNEIATGSPNFSPIYKKRNKIKGFKDKNK